MPRNNKITEKVFAEIAETNDKKGAYEKFLAVDELLGLPVGDPLKKLKKDYEVLVKVQVDDIKVLAALEEIIIQIRAKEVINSELRLSLSRNYIYARSLFYRRGKKINDIRVVAGKVSQYGTNLGKLLKDDIFRTICWSALIKAMDKEIEKNITNLNTVYKYEKIENLYRV
jgi:hypothetical protein